MSTRRPRRTRLAQTPRFGTPPTAPQTATANAQARERRREDAEMHDPKTQKQMLDIFADHALTGQTRPAHYYLYLYQNPGPRLAEHAANQLRKARWNRPELGDAQKYRLAEPLMTSFAADLEP